MKDAHKKAIEYAKEAGAIISFDPNIRLALWKNASDLKAAILEFMPKANILKVSDEEIEFITGKKRWKRQGISCLREMSRWLSTPKEQMAQSATPGMPKHP